MSAEYPDYYAILDVSPAANPVTIRRQYLRLMQQARRHPDLGGDHSGATLINEAYTVLRSPLRRQAYDRIYLNRSANLNKETRMTRSSAVWDGANERRCFHRCAYTGMVLLLDAASNGYTGQCEDISVKGCSFRTLRRLCVGEVLQLVFQDDPGMTLSGVVRWKRIIPQRFGPPLFAGGVEFSGEQANRFSTFIQRIGYSESLMQKGM